MGLYAGNPGVWANDVYQFEQTDPVQGGIGGIDNMPLIHLADRTAWLKERLGLSSELNGEVVLTGNASIGANLAGDLITIYATAITTLTLDSAATFRHGALIILSAFCNPGYVVNVNAPGGQPIFDTDGVVTQMHMHHKEHLILVALTDHFKVMNASGNFYCAGEEIKARKEIGNSIAYKGQLLQRAAYPRLWKYVSSRLVMFQEIVPEWLYFFDATTYRGCYTDGDGVSTFRIPDERGTFDRMLDLGRGLDIDRAHNFAGGYEADEFKSHKHIWNYGTERDDNSTGGSYDEFTMRPFGQYENRSGIPDPIRPAGGNETRGKNIAKLNCVKF